MEPLSVDLVDLVPSWRARIIKLINAFGEWVLSNFGVPREITFLIPELNHLKRNPETSAISFTAYAGTSNGHSQINGGILIYRVVLHTSAHQSRFLIRQWQQHSNLFMESHEFSYFSLFFLFPP